MTDTSKAPERIWAVVDEGDISADILGGVYAQQIPDGMVGTPNEYILKSYSDAQLAAAYEAAARAMRPMLRSMASRGEAAQTIRALTPEDAKAALEQVRREAFRAGMERAAGIADRLRKPPSLNFGHWDQRYESGHEAASIGIAAEIREAMDDE